MLVVQKRRVFILVVLERRTVIYTRIPGVQSLFSFNLEFSLLCLDELTVCSSPPAYPLRD